VSTAQLEHILQHFPTLAQARNAERLTDGELLRRFSALGDEEAFTALVRRHGPMVLQVCRRLLHDVHAAEDVFQAVFLVLARRPETVRKPEAVGSWLHGVAFRLARRARAEAARRHFHETRHAARPPSDPLAEVSGRELLAVLDDELNRLPDVYRGPLVLCCLQGRTRDEAAQQLGWALRTLERRLERGRAILHARLARRGLTVAALLSATLLLAPPARALPAGLLAATVKAARAFAAHAVLLPGAVSARAVALAEATLQGMLVARMTTMLALTLTVTLLTAGVWALAQPASPARPAEEPPARRAEPAAPAPAQRAEPGAKDAHIAQTEDALAAGLQWLVRQQAADGCWSLDGSPQNDVAATAFALLPLLGAGHTHKTTDGFHPYARSVDRGLRFLLRVQQPNGSFGREMYSHALATRALCEAYGLTADPVLRPAAQKALDYIVQAQHDQGGWRYSPRQPGDTSVTSYQVLALTSGQTAGLKVPRQVLILAGKFLDSTANADGTAYGYVPGSPGTPTMTAAGLLCRLALGGKSDDRGLVKVAAVLRQDAPGPNHADLYRLHYETQVLAGRGGKDWEFWEPRMRKFLLDRQQRWGSWPADASLIGRAGGQVALTSLALLTLQTCARADRPVQLPARELKASELPALYAALGDEDFVAARRALRSLAAAPRQSVPFLKGSLRPAAAIDSKRIEQLIADLDAEQFAVRVKATAELEKLAELAHPALRKALTEKPSLEMRRRIEQVLEATERVDGTAEQRRVLHAVEVLVQAGTPEARQVLETLARGAPEARLTQWAKAGLARLDRRPNP
jgi:RNA polymerase sigma factor (sigma-70 family)